MTFQSPESLLCVSIMFCFVKLSKYGLNCWCEDDSSELTLRRERNQLASASYKALFPTERDEKVKKLEHLKCVACQIKCRKR